MCSGVKGMMAQMSTTVAKVMMGARLNSSRSAPLGVMSSLVSILSASASDCSRP